MELTMSKSTQGTQKERASNLDDGAKRRFNEIMAGVEPFIKKEESSEFNTFGRWTTATNSPVNVPNTCIDCQIEGDND